VVESDTILVVMISEEGVFFSELISFFSFLHEKNRREKIIRSSLKLSIIEYLFI
jgi:hypothetical protein